MSARGDELAPVLAAAHARARTRGRAVIAARSAPLPAPPDPLALYARAEELGLPRFAATSAVRELTLVGVGETAVLGADTGARDRSAIAALADALRELWLDADDASRGELVAVGGFAFDARESAPRDTLWRAFGAGRLALPGWTLRIERGAARLGWALRVAPGDDPLALARELAEWRMRLLAAPAPSTAPPRLRPPPDALSSRYARSASALIEAIRAGAARKVVLADTESLALDGNLDAARVLRALRAAHPGCLVFAQGIGAQTFLGATPERMVALAGDRVSASALAGTAAPGTDLLASAKDRAEHAFVVEAIAQTLRTTCDDVEIPAEPSLLRTGRVVHLQTELRARARPGTRLLELVERLHPTPAVAGTPRPAALELIRKHEAFDRGWYAGPIGWIDANGEGEFHVSLRCGLLSPGELRVFAGAGLVAASDPVREAAETRLKLGALLEPLGAACAS
jgi:salicylate biosynthesis isochorismate synthase/menaquinone-specific isochorismate synthase